MTTGRHRTWLAVILLLLGAAACTETNEYLIEIGVTQLRLLDGDLKAQSVTDPNGTIQAIDWTITEATLTVDGEEIDLLFDETECFFTDTVYVPPQAEGKCASGTILGSVDEEDSISAHVNLKFQMIVRRAEPVDIASDPTGDFEGDGVPNAADICPFAHDPSQEEHDGNGVACTTIDPGTGVTLPDADGDGWEDAFDNCIWYPNPDQADANRIPDGIGDRCPEQTASVSGAGAIIEIDRPIDIPLQRNEFNYLVVDFNTNASLSQCSWSDGDGGSCAFDQADVDVCVNNATIGCAP
jgi:hypothetical protein